MTKPRTAQQPAAMDIPGGGLRLGIGATWFGAKAERTRHHRKILGLILRKAASAGLAEPMTVDPRHSMIWAATEAGSLAGIALIGNAPWAGALVLRFGWVEPALRRRGVYRLLVHAVNAFADEAQLREVLAGVLLSNPDSLAAHQALGFVERPELSPSLSGSAPAMALARPVRPCGGLAALKHLRTVLPPIGAEAAHGDA